MDFNVNDLAVFVQRAVIQGIPLIYGSTGEIITEKSGNLNLGIPGIMYVGAISGVAGAFLYENSVPAGEPINAFLGLAIPLLCSLLGSLIMALIYSFLTITLRANQNVTGLALTTFGVGLGNFFGGSLAKLFGSGTTGIAFNRVRALFIKKLPFAEDCGWFGTAFLSYTFLAYFAIALAIAVAMFIRKSRIGLNLRAVGESPATADAAGINVIRYKYFATCFGGMIAGLGGLYYVVDYIGVWSNGGFGDRGWLAVALVIFVIWRPNLAIPGALLFGALYILPQYVDGLEPAQKKLFEMIPYVATLLVLIITSIRNRRENQPPASLGLAYFREER